MNRSGFVGVLAAVFIGLWAVLAGYMAGHCAARHQVENAKVP